MCVKKHTLMYGICMYVVGVCVGLCVCVCSACFRQMEGELFTSQPCVFAIHYYKDANIEIALE